MISTAMQRTPSVKSTSTKSSQGVMTRGMKKMLSRKEISKIDLDVAQDNATPITPLGNNEPQTNMSSVCRLTPPRGEKRYVFLDPQEEHFGFKLETYFRPADERKTLRTFVQSVKPQSPAFMAGLAAGDTIVEIDGSDVRTTPAEVVVNMIKACRGRDQKIKLAVEFVDGTTRLDMMKRGDALKRELRQKQQRLKELVEKEGQILPPSPPHPRPLVSNLQPSNAAASCTDAPIDAAQRIISTEGWEVWEAWETTVYKSNSHVNNPVVLYVKEATTLACDVMVMPSSSCWTSSGSSPPDNVLFQYLKQGGRGLLDELSLVKQGRPGEVMSTGGHGLPVQRIFHCLMGSNDDSAQLCVAEALRQARSGGHLTVAFWVDGFAHVQVPPQKLVEAVRQWLAEEDGNKQCFRNIIFTCTLQIKELLSIRSI